MGIHVTMHAIERAMGAHQHQAEKANIMAGRKSGQRRKIDTRGPLQRALDNEGVQVAQSYLDVITPEMAAKGVYSAKSGGRRYYRLQHVDRLHSAGKLTYEQHQAAVWYRDQWDAGQYDRPPCSDYTRVRGQNVVAFTLPINAEQARRNWRAARSCISQMQVGMVDQVVLHNRWPRHRQHRARESMLTDLRRGLDCLAHYLRL